VHRPHSFRLDFISPLKYIEEYVFREGIKKMTYLIKDCRLAVIVGLFLFAMTVPGFAAASGPGAGLETDEVISTTIRDAQLEVPFLDHFHPMGAQPLGLLPKNMDGSYQLDQPGYYLFEAQSYCLNPGKYAPGDDAGYLYAPMKGAKAHIIKNILKRSSRYPEITQEEIQTLIWAVASRSEISFESRELYAVAKKLMSREELLEANSGVVRKIVQRVWERMIQRMPPQLQNILQAQARIRDLIRDAQSSYEDLVAAAVLEGEPPAAKGSREVPQSRWSFHPDGYFIRLHPRGFSAMLIELYLPGDVRVEYDRADRIISIGDSRGNTIKTEYQDAAIQKTDAEYPGMKKCHFSSVLMSIPDPDNAGKILTRKWTGSGWTFFGTPGAPKKNSAADPRWEKARIHQAELNHLLQIVLQDDAKIRSLWLSAGGVRLMNLMHYFYALTDIVQELPSSEDNGWEFRQLNLVKGAWSQNLSQLAKPQDDERRGFPPFLVIGFGGGGPGSAGGTSFDPSGVTGAGGNAGLQALAASGAGTDANDDCTQQFADDREAATEEHEECIEACPLVDPKHPEESVFLEICLQECWLTLWNALKEIEDTFYDCLGLE